MKGYQVVTSLFLCVGLMHSAMAEDIYRVTHIKQGESLKLKQTPSRNSKTLVAIPHDASWMVRRDRGRTVVDKVVWRKVQWNQQQGWVSDYYLQRDANASVQTAKRKQCLNDRNIKQKMCCGYPEADRKRPYEHIPILAVRNIPVGESLILRSAPSPFSGKNLVAIPHNATWIADLGERKTHPSGSVWAKVRWSGKTGWLDTAYVTADRQTTHIGDQKRKMCAIAPR